MMKQISFLAISVFITLSVNSQYADGAINSDIQQPSIPLSDFRGAIYSFENQPFLLNTDQTATQQLDSIIYYRYAEVDDAWSLKSYRRCMYYDKDFNDTLILQSTWDETTNSWVDRAKEIKQYNANKQILRREFYLISRSGNLTEYTYNDTDDLIEVTESYLSSGEWRYKTKSVKSYNSDNVLQADTLYHRFTFSGTSVWRKTRITNFYYFTGGNLSADTIYTRPWLSGDNFGDWELFGNTIKTYGIDEYSTETTSYRWNSDSNAFNPYTKERILYKNEDKALNAHIKFDWNKTLEFWDTTQMIQYGYSDNDFMINYEKRTWGDSPSKVLEIFDFDYAVANDELLLPTSAINANTQLAFHHKINSKQSISYDLSKNETQQFRETKYYYSSIETKTPTTDYNISNVRVELYPNPASEFITISFPNSFHKAWLELFNVNGKKVLSQSVSKDENINIGKLKGGSYIYRIQVEAEIQVGKLLIK